MGGKERKAWKGARSCKHRKFQGHDAIDLTLDFYSTSVPLAPLMSDTQNPSDCPFERVISFEHL